MARRQTGLDRPTAGPVAKVASTMNDILLFGLAAIVLVIVMAGLLGLAVDHDDLSSYTEG
jgi:hypothetical protein